MSSLRFAPRRTFLKVIVTIGLMLLMTTLTGVITSVEAQAQTAFPEATGFVVQASADAMKMDVATGLFGGAFPAIPPDEPPLSGSAAHTEAVYDDLGNNSGVASAPHP